MKRLTFTRVLRWPDGRVFVAPPDGEGLRQMFAHGAYLRRAYWRA